MKLLIADDDKVSRTALREIVGAPHGWEIFEVEDGQAALDALCDGLRADLCIIDLKMPRLDGMELLKRIRRDPHLKSLKIVVTSATRDRETIVALAKLQISGYLLKPYDIGKTKAVLQPLLPGSADPSLASRNLLKRTLLVLDHDAASLDTLRAMVAKMANWELLSAASGDEALNTLRAGLRPDLVLANLRSPGMEGARLVQEIRNDPQLENIRVAVISQDQERDELVALAPLKIFGYLLKPCSAPKLQELLYKVEADR